MGPDIQPPRALGGVIVDKEMLGSGIEGTSIFEDQRDGSRAPKSEKFPVSMIEHSSMVQV